MIIRIATEGQYRVSGSTLDTLDQLDNAILDAIGDEDEERFEKALKSVLDLIRTEGSPLPDNDLKESDLILPPPDTTIEQARDLFAEYPRDLV